MRRGRVNYTVLHKQQSIPCVILCHLLLLNTCDQLIYNLGVQIRKRCSKMRKAAWVITVIFLKVYLPKTPQNMVLSVHPGFYSFCRWRWNMTLSRDPESMMWYKRRKKMSQNLNNPQQSSDLLTVLIQQKVGFRKLSTLDQAWQFHMNNNTCKLWRK